KSAPVNYFAAHAFIVSPLFSSNWHRGTLLLFPKSKLRYHTAPVRQEDGRGHAFTKSSFSSVVASTERIPFHDHHVARNRGPHRWPPDRRREFANLRARKHSRRPS